MSPKNAPTGSFFLMVFTHFRIYPICCLLYIYIYIHIYISVLYLYRDRNSPWKAVPLFHGSVSFHRVCFGGRIGNCTKRCVTRNARAGSRKRLNVEIALERRVGTFCMFERLWQECVRASEQMNERMNGFVGSAQDVEYE